MMARYPSKRPRFDEDIFHNNNNNNSIDDRDNHDDFEYVTREEIRDILERISPSDSVATVPNIAMEPGNNEVLPQDLVDGNPFIQGLFDSQRDNQSFSQESVASNVSYASLNEDARSLRSFASNSQYNSGMNLDSPAGSQPTSNAASLPIQFPSSQGSVSSQESQDEREVPGSGTSPVVERPQPPHHSIAEPNALSSLLLTLRNGTYGTWSQSSDSNYEGNY